MSKKSKIDWDAQVPLLGTISDRKIAKMLGCSPDTVSLQRKARGICSCLEKIDWSSQPLGEMPDPKLAQLLGVPSSTVTTKRVSAGIPSFTEVRTSSLRAALLECPEMVYSKAFEQFGVSKSMFLKHRALIQNRPKRQRELVDWDVQPLGIIMDSELAEALKIPIWRVQRERKKRGIPPVSFVIDWDSQPLGTCTDAELASRLGVSSGAVASARQRRNIPAFDQSSRRLGICWDSVGLGSKSDRALAKELNVKTVTVYKARKCRNIPPFVDPNALDWSTAVWETPNKILAAKFGVSEQTIRRKRLKYGVPEYKFTYITSKGIPANFPEALIDLYFDLKGVDHVFQFDVGKYTADWIVTGDTLVEYVGWSDHPSLGAVYLKKLDIKLKFYDSLGYKTLVIWPKDLLNYNLGVFPAHTGHFISVGKDLSLEPLGKVPDLELDRRLGVASGTVKRARYALGIPAYKIDKIDWGSQPLGQQTDVTIAKTLGVSIGTVLRARNNLGITRFNPPKSPSINWGAVNLGNEFDSSIAKRLGVSYGVVREARVKAGIPPYQETHPRQPKRRSKRKNS